MERVLGVGGVFIRFRDRDHTARWYRDHLGIDLNEAWWGTAFPLSTPADKDTARLVWGAFPAETTYFGPADRQFMINFRVADLDAMLAQLRHSGCDVDDKVERSEYGAFGWVTDPEGNRIELWEPPEEPPDEG